MATINGLNNKYNLGFTTQAGVNFTPIVLTSASTEMQVVTGTAVGVSFTLPVESTIPNGSQFTIVNLGTQSLSITSSGGGSVLSALPANQNVVVSLVNNSVTTAAAWNYGNGAPLITTYTGTTTGLTPLFGAGSSGSNTCLLNYVRINKVMTFEIYLAWSSLAGASTGAVTIPGLPVTIPGTYSGVCSIYATTCTYTGALVAAVQPTSSTVSLYTQASGAGLTALPSTAIAATTQMSITGTIITN